MNKHQIKNLEKNSVYMIHVTDELKDSTIDDYLDELSKKIKKEVKRNELVVFVMKVI